MFPFSRPPRPPHYGLLAPDHAAACAALHAGAFAHGWAEIEFERLLASHTSYADAAFEGTQLTGFILSRVAADEAEVLTVVVNPRARRHGIGRALVERHLGRLAAARIATLFLEVNQDNAAARALYARCGFAEVGRRKGYYPGADGQPADALVLRRSIA